jgi:protein-S-isoprenylcysteine O-methyltransferase Ste14
MRSAGEQHMKTIRSLASFLYTVLIYVSLPLLGWGLDDLSGFFSSPQLLIYSMSIAAFGLVAAYAVQRPGGLGDRGKGQEDKFVSHQRIVRIFVTAMLLAALVFVPFADRRSIGVMAGSPAMRWAGLLLATLGMGLIFWSGLELGRLYSPEVTLQKDHQLITSGAYRFIRHPRYLGGMLQGIGLSLLFRSWIGLGLTFVFVLIILFRIKDEEALMGREFGKTWQQYCDHSWRLVPFVF